MLTINSFLKKNPEVRKLLLFVFGAIGIIFFTNHLIKIFAPFLIAYIITMLTHGLIDKMVDRIKIPRVFATLICMILVLIICCLVVWFLIYQLSNAITYSVNIISKKFTYASIRDTINSVLLEVDSWSERLSLDIDSSAIINEVYDFVKSFVKTMSTFSLNLILDVPQMLISIIMGCLASFYMMYDYKKTGEFFNRQLSSGGKKFIRVFNENVLISILKMIFSYVILSSICFVELSLGFLILGIKDAWFIGLIIAIVDVLPILGSGGILVPWAIISMITHNVPRGIGLLVLWVVIIIVRQIAEPKVVGSQVELHPLIIIMSMYIGLQTMGTLGILMAPLYVVICKKLNEHHIIHLYK